MADHPVMISAQHPLARRPPLPPLGSRLAARSSQLLVLLLGSPLFALGSRLAARSSQLLLLLGLWLAACSVQLAHAYPMPPEFYKLSDELTSWHIPWAKPYAGGTIKALVIAPRGTQRETLELAQRLNLDYTYVLTLTTKEAGWTAKSGSYAPADGISNEEVLHDLRGKLQADYDLLIIGHLQWSMFPNDILYSILKKVHDGTGLVYTYSAFGRTDKVNRMLAKGPGSDPEKFVTTGIPFAALPVLGAMGADKVVQLRQFKRGRIAALDYGPKRPRFQFLTPYPPDDVEAYTDLHYEHYMSLVIKSALWAARRTPPLFFRSWGTDGATFQRDAVAGATLAATVFGKAVPGRIDAEMTVRKADGAVVLKQSQQFAMDAAEKSLTFKLTTLPRGRYFADLVLRRGERSVNWATTFFDVESAVHIASVTTSRAWYRPGQKVRATVKLSAPAKEGMQLIAAMEDSLGRVIAGAAMPLNAGDTSAGCAPPIENPLTITAKLCVALVDAKGLVHEHKQGFSIVRRKWDDFLFCVWTAGSHFNERVRRLMFKQITQAGVDTFTNSSRNAIAARRSAELGFWNIPYMTRYSYSGSDNVRKPCLTDPKFLDKHLAGLEEVARAQRPFDPQAYTLGDECFLARGGVDVCFSPTCKAEFRTWLRTEYPSVAALNASWGTTLKSFDEAEPITLADAKKAGQIPRWVDHRRFMEFVYARMMDRAKEAIRRADPTARVGFDGPFGTSSRSGNDWWRLMEVFDLCNIYFHEPDEWEHVRSFARPGTLLGLWYGGYGGQQNEDYSRFFPWRAVLNGYNSVWWYAVYHGLSACPMDAVTPSMTQYPYFAASVEEVREIKAGVGKALMNATRLDDGIAVHYSQPSIHASTAYPGLGVLYSTQRQWYALLEDMGFQYTCYAYAQIERQGIDPARFRVLVLPYSQAVSPKEAQAIATYVRAGGTVIADVRPAIADQHGRRHTPGLLDTLFGITRADGKLDLKRGVDGTLTKAVGQAPAGAVFKNLVVDPNIALAGAQALARAGDVPLLIVNQVGKGRAILLNFSVAFTTPARDEARADGQWKLFKGILAMADVRPRVSLRTAAGGLRKSESVFFRDGAIEYLGFLKYRCTTTEPPQDAEVRLDAPAHTYDCRTGAYLGKVARFAATFQIQRGKLYARLPYAVDAVAVKPAKAKALGGEVVRVQLGLVAKGGAKPGRHWFRVEVFGPDKAERRHYAQNVAVVEGRGEAVIPLALNDASGVWRITARDVASGVRAEAAFTVQSAGR